MEFITFYYIFSHYFQFPFLKLLIFFPFLFFSWIFYLLFDILKFVFSLFDWFAWYKCCWNYLWISINLWFSFIYLIECLFERYFFFPCWIKKNEWNIFLKKNQTLVDEEIMFPLRTIPEVWCKRLEAGSKDLYQMVMAQDQDLDQDQDQFYPLDQDLDSMDLVHMT